MGNEWETSGNPLSGANGAADNDGRLNGSSDTNDSLSGAEACTVTIVPLAESLVLYNLALVEFEIPTRIGLFESALCSLRSQQVGEPDAFSSFETIVAAVGLDRPCHQEGERRSASEISPGASCGQEEVHDPSELAQLEYLSLLKGKVDALLAYPERRLASYGSLQPGESNYHIVEEIEGEWLAGSVHGKLTTELSYFVFHWDETECAPESKIPVQVLCSEALPEHLRRIDEFEGDNYQRIVVPVHMKSGDVVACSIYAKNASRPSES